MQPTLGDKQARQARSILFRLGYDAAKLGNPIPFDNPDIKTGFECFQRNPGSNPGSIAFRKSESEKSDYSEYSDESEKSDLTDCQSDLKVSHETRDFRRYRRDTRTGMAAQSWGETLMQESGSYPTDSDTKRRDKAHAAWRKSLHRVKKYH